MAERPTGTVTFLFTDVEGSTRLWDEHPSEMKAALERHDEILRSVIEGHDGYVFSTAGDAFAAAFSRVGDAVSAAEDAQRTLGTESWPTGISVRVRMGLHTGEAQERDGDYFGPVLNRAARIMSAANGGQILCSGVTGSLAAETTPVDLGERRLRDLSEPMRLMRIDVPGTDPVTSAPRTLDQVPGNLPIQLNSFLGREELLEAVGAAVETDRLVTLTGVGGVGKTRTAVQAAAELASGFTHGAWLVELASVRDPSEVAGAVLSCLGMRRRGDDEPLVELVRELADWEVLLVLDNAEHVVSAVAATADVLLRQCPNVRILVTSREGLAVPGERLMAIPPLQTGAGSDQRWPEAVRLFEVRAAASSPGFTVTADVAGDVHRLCERLDGVPLAVELAAARVKMMTPAEIADRLDERFRLLTGGARTAVERHQTLRASVDWSFDLLPAAAKRVLSRLGVFVGSFSLTEAQALAGDGDLDGYAVLDAVTTLVDQSLLSSIEANGATRYWMLETLRQYAIDRLAEAGELDTFRLRHKQVFLESARQAGDQFLTASQIAVLASVEADGDNYRAAMGFAIEHQDLDTAFEIAAALTPLHQFHSRVGELARFALAAPSARTQPLWPTVASGPIYDEWIPAGHQPDLDSLYDSDRAPLRPLTTKIIETYDLWYRGNLDQALTSADRWINEATQADSGHDTAYANAVLAHLQHVAGVDATRSASACLEIAERLDIPSLLSFAFAVMGMALEGSDPSQAIDYLSRGLETAKDLRSDFGIGLAAAHLAAVAGDADTARTVLDAIRPYITTEAATRPGAQRSFLVWVAADVALIPLGEFVAAARLLGFIDNLRGDLGWGSTEQFRTQTVEALENALPAGEFNRHRARGTELSTPEALGELQQVLSTVGPPD